MGCPGCASGFCTDGVCCGEALCAVGSSCATSSKKGACAKKNATPCATDAECGSAHCVDGVCCNRACDGQCEACDVPGSVGACAPIVGTPHGARTACSDGAGDVCAARTCDGAVDPAKCSAFAASASAVCKPASCTGTTFVGASTCGAGACSAPAAIECTPYRCDDAGCRTACSKAEHCAEGNVCIDGACKPLLATCSADRLSSTAKDGTVTACGNYRCTPSGVCGTQCATSLDCAPLSVCDSTTRTCVASSAGADEGGGCAFGSGHASGASLLTLCLCALASRRSRSTRGSTRSA